LHEWADGRTAIRTLCASEVALPVVATLSPSTLETAQGEDDADVIFFEGPPGDGSFFSVLSASGLGASRASNAEVVVTAGAGAEHCLDEVDRFAAALGAVRASTQTLADRIGGSAPVVDIRHERVAPRLYIACGASGSPQHLDAISSGATIVAIDRDPKAPVVRAAHYALLGDLSSLLGDLIQAAEKEPS
jgi:electron transfer flavoprotein alpha subunit